ncbi:hypothetical protein PC9H_001755 [Pleurotus ostreatus]|uniref:Cytochrome P450 n=1 Tax=Pleurotus ostreatus TaxID=5322 RepID=A0A8H7AB31_PLEOS|nr:uncharacterized protein PC9H_001755 [Pleurotus ostreatus]KAF7441405.1 hypothetical protein PC9H_001755 [Pleurotus ostreatus]
MPSNTLLVTLALLLSLTGFCRWRRKARLPLPPGPKGYPIVGNLFDKPTEYHWVKYLEWSKQYELDSDVVSFHVFGQPTIILNSRKAVNDLLSVRSSLYSDRRAEEYNDQRAEFTSGRLTYQRPKQLRHIHGLLRRLLKEPNDFFHHISYSLSTSIISIAYGLDAKSENDPNIERCEAAIGQLSKAAMDGNYLVDALPILKYVPRWMPGAGFKAYADEARPKTLAMLDVPYFEALKRMGEGTTEQSVVSSCLAKVDHSGEGPPAEEIARDVASIAYLGGSETSHLALKTFFAAMLLYPDVQRRGQKELDAHVGSQLPTFDDLPHMPYIHAIMFEVLRWQAVLPLCQHSSAPPNISYSKCIPAIAHRLTEDDTYNGYHLPKGATVFANTWFFPDRFLKNGRIDLKLCDVMPNFGYGRRICPGRHFAMDSLQMSIASILTVFNIEKARDNHGQVIEPDIKYISGSTRHIRPFKCAITPRSPGAEKLVNNADLL